jgi:hypothetical protein
VLLESGIEWLAKLTVEAQSVLLENAVDLEDWGSGSRSGVKEQVKVEAEGEKPVSVSGPLRVEPESR